MKLIIITKDTFFPEEASWINAMMSDFNFILHIRKPFASLAETENFLQHINPSYYGRIVLHDHYTLAEAYRLKGIHLNARNRDFKMEGVYWKQASISRSCPDLHHERVQSLLMYDK